MQKNLAIEMKAPDFYFMTPWTKGNNFYRCIGSKKSILLFLRYLGCTTCQLRIHNLINTYRKFQDKGAQIFVVLQSDPEIIKNKFTEGEIPFTIICDTDQYVYKLYNVRPLESKPDQFSPNLLKKIEQARSKGFKHGLYEGNELQLPATFLINSQKKIEFVYYGQDYADIPDHDDLLALLETIIH